MERKKRMDNLKKLLAYSMVLVMAVTFIPLLGNGVRAAEKAPSDADKGKVRLEGDTGGLSAKEIAELATKDGKTINEDELKDLGITLSEEAPSGIEPMKAKDKQTEPKMEVKYSTEKDMESVPKTKTPKDVEEDDAALAVQSSEDGAVEIQDSYSKPIIYTSMNKATGELTLRGTLAANGSKYPHYYFGKIIVDDMYKVTDILESKTLNYSVNMKNYSLGYHTVSVQILEDPSYSSPTYNTKDWIDITNVPTYLYSKPTAVGAFQVYSNYLDYMPMNFLSGSMAIRMEYSADGVHWNTSGYMPYYYRTYSIGGLAPNTTYQTRIYYYRTSPINGHYFNGAETGSYLYTGTYKTGPAKMPKIKSIKVKAVKVKRHKVRQYGYYTGLYLGTVKYYTYKIKVTVRLKKKPKAAGMFINGKYVKGKKKKYTATFGTYSNYSKPRGKKFHVYVATYNDRNYGGYSPLKYKKKKVK